MTRLAVVVPHYRQAEFLAECVDSLLSQTRQPDEIIVADSSPADTERIMPRYGASVRHIVLPPTGVAAARNAGLAATSCELVAFLDADNAALPDRVQRQVQTLEQYPQAVLCHGAMVLVDRDGAQYPGASRFESEHVAFERQLGWLLERNRIAADTVCVRRDIVMALGGFCETRGVREDYDLWLRLASIGPFRYVGMPLARYRRHETNLSNDERYMFEWEAGALRRVDWPLVERALTSAFPDPHRRAIVEGEIRLRRGECDLAERHFETLTQGPQAATALFHLAHLAFDRGELDRTERFLAAVLEREPDDPASWNNLGVLQALRGDLAHAVAAFTRAIECRAHYFDAAANLDLARRGGAGEWRMTRRRLRAELMPLAAVARPAVPNEEEM